MTSFCTPEMSEAIEQRCRAARSGALTPYGAMLRANTLQVVSSTFPKFAERRGARALTEDVDMFVRDHRAVEAQFCHLASEFVLFAKSRDIDGIDRALLEYEWTLFAVEIADVPVLPPVQGCDDRSGCQVKLNPSARLIALPFDLLAGIDKVEKLAAESLPPFVYAVYRTWDHRIMSRALNSSDIARLRNITASEIQVNVSARDVWISEALRSGLLIDHRQ